MLERDVDLTSLAAGVVVIAIGTITLLDRLDVLDLRFGYLWPLLAAALGAILVAGGLDDGD